MLIFINDRQRREAKSNFLLMIYKYYTLHKMKLLCKQRQEKMIYAS